MPNGEDGVFQAQWCRDKHKQIDRQFYEVWSEEHGGFKAVWENIDRLNAKLWGILVVQFTILGGIIAVLLRS